MSTALRRVLVTVAVLVVLFVVADRVADYVAERTAADRIKDSQNLDSAPNVDIAGFPFLTQLAAGDFDKITVTAHDLPVGNAARQLELAHLKVVLHGVSSSRNFSTVRADSAVATARITYAELSQALGIHVTYAGNGRVRASASVTVLGRTISGSITSRPRLHDNALSFGDTKIDGAGNLVTQLIDALNRVFDVQIPLTNIPFRVQVRSLQADPGGITIALTGRDLVYTR